ncbi:MAG: hypothetical protein K9N55_01270 [Phycisphaerae bacterium]|nr:hypothetical protein [Phycisphaerae bacterium]
MPTLQAMAQQEGAFSGGHRLCAGCPVPIITKMQPRAVDKTLDLAMIDGQVQIIANRDL